MFRGAPGAYDFDASRHADHENAPTASWGEAQEGDYEDPEIQTVAPTILVCEMEPAQVSAEFAEVCGQLQYFKQTKSALVNRAKELATIYRCSYNIDEYRGQLKFVEGKNIGQYNGRTPTRNSTPPRQQQQQQPKRKPLGTTVSNTNSPFKNRSLVYRQNNSSVLRASEVGNKNKNLMPGFLNKHPGLKENSNQQPTAKRSGSTSRSVTPGSRSTSTVSHVQQQPPQHRHEPPALAEEPVLAHEATQQLQAMDTEERSLPVEVESSTVPSSKESPPARKERKDEPQIVEFQPPTVATIELTTQHHETYQQPSSPTGPDYCFSSPVTTQDQFEEVNEEYETVPDVSGDGGERFGSSGGFIDADCTPKIGATPRQLMRAALLETVSYSPAESSRAPASPAAAFEEERNNSVTGVLSSSPPSCVVPRAAPTMELSTRRREGGQSPNLAPVDLFNPPLSQQTLETIQRVFDATPDLKLPTAPKQQVEVVPTSSHHFPTASPPNTTSTELNHDASYSTPPLHLKGRREIAPVVGTRHDYSQLENSGLLLPMDTSSVTTATTTSTLAKKAKKKRKGQTFTFTPV